MLSQTSTREQAISHPSIHILKIDSAFKKPSSRSHSATTITQIRLHKAKHFRRAMAPLSKRKEKN